MQALIRMASRQYPLMNRTLSKSFANELSKVFNIDEDPQVEELEKNLREKLNSSSWIY